MRPISVPFQGYRVWELPPNNQGIAALEMLRILEPIGLKHVEEAVAIRDRILVNFDRAANLVEIYDADAAGANPASRLINTAVRAQVGTGANVLIPGLVVSAGVQKTVLIRAVGPGIAAPPFSVPGALAEPVMTLFSGSQSVATNTAWNAASNASVIREAARSVGAFALAEGSRDSALLVTLPPGAYTIQVSGANNTSGVALVEVYEVP